MNIESKNWKLKSTGTNLIGVTNKNSGQRRHIKGDKLPPIQSLSLMTESRFDEICERSFYYQCFA